MQSGFIIYMKEMSNVCLNTLQLKADTYKHPVHSISILYDVPMCFDKYSTS